jgi:hypothetical protein
MKLHHTALLTALLFVFGSLSARAEVYDLATTAGKTYHQCHMLKLELDGVSFKHTKGIAKVLFKDLTPQWRQHFGFDPAKARAHELKQQEDKARARDEAAKRANELAKAQQEAMTIAMENEALQALRIAALNNNGGGYGFNGFIGLTSSVPTQFYTEQQIVDGRRYYCTRPVHGSADVVAISDCNSGALTGSRVGWRNVGNARYFSTGCNTNGFTPTPFFAVPGIGPNVAPMAARPPCVIRGGGVIGGH